eukprot:PhF_6_TR514/c0_g1_i3/m.297
MTHYYSSLSILVTAAVILNTLPSPVYSFDCSTFTCRIGNPTFIMHPTDSTSGSVSYNSKTAKCLTGPVWEKRLKELGAGLVDRSNRPIHLYYGDWLSSEIVTTIFHILLEEALGYNVIPSMYEANARDVLCCDQTLVRLEVWLSSGLLDSDSSAPDITSLPLGYSGYSGLFVPQNTLDKYPMATSSNSYHYLPSYSNIYTKAFQTPCDLLKMNDTLGCTEDNLYCSDSRHSWLNQGPPCQQGRYVPPQCSGSNAQYCQEIYHATPLYDQGFFEGLVNNSKLNFTIAYLGQRRMPQYIAEQTKAKKDFVFYWWAPDPLISIAKAQPILFKSSTTECAMKTTSFPYTNQNDCGYPTIPLKKIVRRRNLLQDTDFRNFFEGFMIVDSTMSNLISKQKQGGGDNGTLDIACEWVQTHFDTWKDWIRNTRQDTVVVVTSSMDINPWFYTIPACVALMLIGATMLVWSRRGKSRTKNAPVKKPLCIMFTDVEGSTVLWESQPEAMAEAMRRHHMVVRRLIAEYSCYEVKSLGDSLMIAGTSVVDGLLLALAVQDALHNEKWPMPLRHVPGVGTGPEMMWNGLRVRIGVHLAHQVEQVYDVIHQSYDYYGHDVNVAARIESLAIGGQTLLSRAAFDEIKDSPEYEVLFSEDTVVFTPLTEPQILKGVEHPMDMISALPRNLRFREFNNVGGPMSSSKSMVAQDINSEDDGSPKRSNSFSSAAQSFEFSSKSLQTLFRLCPPEDNDAVTRTFAKACDIPQDIPVRRRIARIIAHVHRTLMQNKKKSYMPEDSIDMTNTDVV